MERTISSWFQTIHEILQGIYNTVYNVVITKRDSILTNLFKEFSFGSFGMIAKEPL